MKKLLFLFIGILIASCCNQPELLKNGLTKKAREITEYTIKVKKDSRNEIINDTLSKTTKRYNGKDQIIYRIQLSLIDNEEMEIDYIYDDYKKIKREIVKMSADSLPYIVNYIYKDSILHQSKGIVENENEKFEQIETYFYKKNETKEKTISSQIFIDLESSDTIRNIASTSYFDKMNLLKELRQLIIKTINGIIK